MNRLGMKQLGMNRLGMKQLSPQAAMVLAFEAAVLIVLVNSPLSLGIAAGLAGWYWLGGGGWRHGWMMGAVLALGAWGVVFSQGLFYEGLPRTPLLVLLPGSVFPFGEPEGLYLYREGLLYGLVQSLRFNAIVLLGGGLLVRYSTDEMAGGLRALRLPAPLCFLFAMTLRFFPLMLAEVKTTWRAQHFRGYRLLPGLGCGLWTSRARRLSPARVLLLPLMAAQVRKADQIAAALHSRGFSPGESDGVTELESPLPAARREVILCAVVGACLAALAAAQLLARLRLDGILDGLGSERGGDSGRIFGEWLDWLISTVLRHV